MPGPYYIAWADFGDTFGPEHYVFDLRVLSFSLQQSENSVATLDIVCQNPREGLLNPGRQRYVFFSKDIGSGPEELFFGRIVGLPSKMVNNKVALSFRAEPEEFDEIKNDFADTLKQLPWYDRLWIDPKDQSDPDTVLLTRTANFHIDRVTHELTISDNFAGEDGTVIFDETEVLRNSVDPQIGTPATSRVSVEAEVRWVQKASGILDISKQLAAGFAASGTTIVGNISSYTIDVLIENWPLPGDDIGGGWSVEDSLVIDGTNRWVSPDEYTSKIITMYAAQNVFADSKILEQLEDLLGADISPTVMVNDSTSVNIPLINIKPTLIVRYRAERQRSEIIRFEIVCDVQDVVSDPGGANVKQLSYASNDASENVDGSESAPEIPIGDVRRAVYFPTDRGKQSFEYLLLRARKELLDNARAVTITFATRFNNIFDVSCRKNASIIDPRLPGGSAVGKIVSYSASLDGNVGLALCFITIACSVGKGNIVTNETGDPDYVEEGYVNQGYQTYSNQFNLVAGDVTYTDFSNIQTDDDGINFFDMKAEDLVLSVIVTNGPTAQEQALNLNRYRETVAEIKQEIAAVQSNVCVNFRSVTGGPFLTTYDVEVSDAMAPQGINLEAV